MSYFDYQAGTLHAENVSVDKIAEQYGTPAYVYSRAALENHWQAFDDAFATYPHLVCYAVKANSNLAVLNVLAKRGSGFDIVSMGELARVIAAGGDPAKTVFSGVGKTEQEIEYALEHGIRCFNVESIPELDRINTVAGRLGKKAPVSIRVNPDVDAQTHPYISTGLKENKFGIAIEDARDVYRSTQNMQHLDVVAVDCHIGSQLTSVSPFVDALERVLSLIDELAEDGIQIKHLDIGGGLGIHYRDETPPTPAEYAQALAPLLEGRDLEILLEPGRAIAGNAGILLTKVEFIKPTEAKCFAIVDAAMNDLLRPALYQSWQKIQTAKQHPTAKAMNYDIVGPICETGDFLGKDRELALEQGDLLAIRSAGAYGFAMSSNYNSRPRAAEVMVDDDKVHLVRERETIKDLYAGEHVIQA